MRVSRSVGGDAFVNSDFDRLVDGEAGSLDVVGEVGLEEWEVPVAAGAGINDGTDDRRALLEGALELFEELEPFRVVRVASRPRAQARGVVRAWRVPSALPIRESISWNSPSSSSWGASVRARSRRLLMP